MIARISNPGSYLAGAVKYNTDKVDLGGGSLLACRNFKTIAGTDLDAASAERLMLQQMRLNSRVEKGVFSCSLNPNIEDLSSLRDLCLRNGCSDKDEFYVKMADLYMKGMGYGEQPFIVFRHNDIDREHIHIVSIRVDEGGNRISNFNEHLRSERVRGEINASLGLSTKGEIPTKDLTAEQKRRLAEHRYEFMESIRLRIGEADSAAKSLSLSGDGGISAPLLKQSQSNLFHSISNALKYVGENYSPKDMKEYNKILSQFGIFCKAADGEDCSGRRFGGCQYGVIGASGEICSALIKGSKFGKEHSLPGLEKRFALAKGQKSLLESASCSRDFIKSSIDAVLKAPVNIDLAFVADRLKASGITLNIARSLDDPSQIKGVSFIDNVHGHAFNGSDLGKAYSFASLGRTISSHNRKLESELRQASFVPKDLFKDAFRSLCSEFNRIRKEEYTLESSAVRSIAFRKADFVSLLEERHLLSPLQAEKVFDSFQAAKVKDLPEIDFKEESYQRRLIASAVQFSLRIPGEQERIDFLHRAGVEVSRRYNTLEFSSSVKSGVSLSFKDICNGIGGDICESVPESPSMEEDLPFNPLRIPEYSDGLQPLTKAERQFVGAFVSPGGKPVKGDFSSVASLLDGEGRQSAAGFASLSKEEISSAFRKMGAVCRGLMRDGSYRYQSDLIGNIGSHKADLLDAAAKAGLNIYQSECAFRLFKESKESDLEGIASDERNAAERRILSAALFASGIKSPSDRAEFMLRMGVTPSFRGGALWFERSDKPQYAVSFSGLASRSERLSWAAPTFRSYVPAPSSSNFTPFSKKERDFVASYNDDTIIKDRIDSRFSSPAAYLPSSEQSRIARLGNSQRIGEILSRHGEDSILATVKALWSRGYVVKPFASESGAPVFKAGMHWGGDDTFIALPPVIQKRLRDSGYTETYRKIDRLVLEGKWNTPKMKALKEISRAADFNDPQLLMDAISRVGKSNRPLAEAMAKAMGSSRHPDYVRVTDLVFYYRGEKTITLPPPSSPRHASASGDASSERHAREASDTERHYTDIGYQEMLDAIRSGCALRLIMGLSGKQESVRGPH